MFTLRETMINPSLFQLQAQLATSIDSTTFDGGFVQNEKQNQSQKHALVKKSLAEYDKVSNWGRGSAFWGWIHRIWRYETWMSF